MKKQILFLLSLLALALPLHADTASKAHAFYFAVIGQPRASNDMHLQAEIDRIRPRQLAFVVANGIRAQDESCTDALYRERKSLLDESDKPLFLSLAGTDWIGCKNEEEKDIRIERLQHLRDTLFVSDTSFGMTNLPLIRQSRSAQYRDFPENTYWQVGAVLFATLNLPADNNHYLNAAGRNNEFEERLVANRYWLQRLFTLARRNRLDGLVIFCDGNPFEHRVSPKGTSRDGFREIRQLLDRLAGKFSGKVLLVHSGAVQKNPVIEWENNLGLAAAGVSWIEIGVTPKSRNLFSVGESPVAKKKKPH